MDGELTRRRPRRGAAGLVAAVGALLLVLVGCSPVTPDESARARQATSGPTGQMIFQLPDRATSFDPLAEPDSANLLLAAAHFEPLVSAVDGRIMPRMAVWWGRTDADRRLLVQLKHDRWSDNERMGADDLLFTVEQHLRPESRSPLLPALLRISGAREYHNGGARFVSGLVAESSRTLSISLTEPDANYLARLTGLLVLPAHVYAGRDLGDPGTFRAPPVGSGAYLHSAWSGADSVTLTPNPRVNPFTRLDQVVARYVPPQEVVAELDRGVLDLAGQVPRRDLDRVPATHQVLSAPGDQVVGLSGRGPLADVRVRRAVAYALDRQGLLDRHLGGRGRVTDSVLFAPDWATSPDRSRYGHDPVRARDLLAQAGWRAETVIRLVVLDNDTDRTVWDQVLRQLEAVGVRATVDVRPVTERVAAWGDPRVDGVIDSYAMALPEPALVEPWVSCGSPSGYCNARLDALLAQGRAQNAPTERQETYRTADRILSEELPIVPLWVPDAAVVVVNGRGGVSPLVRPSTAMIDYWGPA